MSTPDRTLLSFLLLLTRFTLCIAVVDSQSCLHCCQRHTNPSYDSPPSHPVGRLWAAVRHAGSGCGFGLLRSPPFLAIPVTSTLQSRYSVQRHGQWYCSMTHGPNGTTVCTILWCALQSVRILHITTTQHFQSQIKSKRVIYGSSQ